MPGDGRAAEGRDHHCVFSLNSRPIAAEWFGLMHGED
jgi:hypothetical protein